MPKASNRWIQLLVLSVVNLTANATRNNTVFGLPPKQFTRATLRGLVTLGLVSLWYWHWQLLLATGVSISLMWLSYRLSFSRYRNAWHKVTTLVSGANRKLLFAVTSGSLGGLFTYMTTVIWLDTENHWLAVGLIAQGLMTLAVLILLLWQTAQQKSDRNSTRFTNLLRDITADNPLKRLIAIRQLTDLVAQSSLNPNERSQTEEYFHFMLAQPQEPQIQAALLDGIELFSQTNTPLPPLDGLLTPIAIKEPT